GTDGTGLADAGIAVAAWRIDRQGGLQGGGLVFGFGEFVPAQHVSSSLWDRRAGRLLVAVAWLHNSAMCWGLRYLRGQRRLPLASLAGFAVRVVDAAGLGHRCWPGGLQRCFATAGYGIERAGGNGRFLGTG